MLKTRQKTGKNAAKIRRKLTPRQRFARLRPNERKALLEFVARLRAQFDDRIQHVILYGSRARGRGDAESDLDVLVLANDTNQDLRDEVFRAACDLTLEYGQAFSAWLNTVQWLERYRDYRLLLYRNIKRDGIELWATTKKLN
jgi:predicted nucleotidyltransferase